MNKFYLGGCFFGCVLCAVQDLMGKEDYLQYANENWCSPWWALMYVPLGVISFLTAINLDN